MDDETYIKMNFKQLPGRSYYYARKRGCVAGKFKNIPIDKFGKKALIWQAICRCGLKSRAFVTFSSITSDLYIKECLQKRLLPFIRQHRSPVKFWPDLATCHYSNATKEGYEANNVDVLPKRMNPPNCPELRPIERYWAIVKGKMRRSVRNAKNRGAMLVAFNKYAAQVDRKSVRALMANIKKNTRKFIRSKEI